MGKTLGNVVDLTDLKGRFPVESIRYFLLRDMVFGQDGNFGYLNLIERTNADLANGLGNLSSRTLSMIQKYCDGVVPKVGDDVAIAALWPDFEKSLDDVRSRFLAGFDRFQFSQALEELWTLIRRADLLISDNKPWVLAKSPEKQAELEAVLRISWETLRWVITLVYPVMPVSCTKLSGLLGFDLVSPNLLQVSLASDSRVSESSEIVFPRLIKEEIMSESNANVAPSIEEAATETIQTDSSEFITIDDFLKVQLRIGEIKVAERIPNADKLLRFEVDLGEGRNRQILAGLAEYYNPESLIGRKVVVVANLKPRKMRGLESEGMICAASLEDSDDNPAIATFLEHVNIGARLK